MSTTKVLPKIPVPTIPQRRKEKSIVNVESQTPGTHMKAQFSKKVTLKITDPQLREDTNSFFLSAASELLFILLPFVVIGMTLGARGQFRTILTLPVWSIAAALITGQTIVSLMSMTAGKIFAKRETIVLLVSILLVCVLMPVLIILATILATASVSSFLAISQGVFFAVSAVVYYLTTVAKAIEAK